MAILESEILDKVGKYNFENHSPYTFISCSWKPSDAIALALRSNIPVTVNQDVFETNSIDLIIDNSNEIEEFKEFIKDIKPEDFS